MIDIRWCTLPDAHQSVRTLWYVLSTLYWPPSENCSGPEYHNAVEARDGHVALKKLQPALRAMGTIHRAEIACANRRDRILSAITRLNVAFNKRKG